MHVYTGETEVASTAGAGSLSLEFEVLSRLTGDRRFGDKAYNASMVGLVSIVYMYVIMYTCVPCIIHLQVRMCSHVLYTIHCFIYTALYMSIAYRSCIVAAARRPA